MDQVPPAAQEHTPAPSAKHRPTHERLIIRILLSIIGGLVVMDTLLASSLF